MDAITVSDSSDDEIIFFPAEPAKPKVVEIEDYSDEVIFCGISKASPPQVVNVDASKKKNRGLVSLGKDVTIVSNIVRGEVETTLNNQDPDIEFLGIRKLENNLASSCGAPRVPAARARSDSFNININSQESLKNTNVTINIDGESNKKKVKLTFLGPSNNNNRNWNNASGPSNAKTPAFNPLSTSTPRNKAAPLSSVFKSAQPSVSSTNQGTYQPVARQNVMRTPTINRKMDVKPTSCYTTIHSSINLSNLNKDSPKSSSNTYICDMKNRLENKLKKVNHSSIKNLFSNNNSTVNNQNRQNPVDSGIVTALNPTISVRNSEKDVERAIEKPMSSPSTDNNKIKSQLGDKPAAKSPLLTSNRAQIESQKTDNGSNSKESESRSKEIESKSKEIELKSKEIKLKSRDVESKEKEIESKEKSQDCSNIKNAEKSTKQSDDKLEKKGNNPCSNSSGSDSKNKEIEPVASTSGLNKKRGVSPLPDPDSSDSSESSKNDDDESSSDSSDYDHFPKPSMTKSALDSLFNKFLDNCTKANKGVPVMKMKSKLKKLYLNSQNITCNEEFIILLKEVSLRMNAKSVKDPLDEMKKILVNLRKDSPTNQKNIQKLEKVLKEINKKIKQFEEAEVTSDEDENDNVYVKLHKYRKRAVEIYNKLCELNSVPADAERPTLRNVSFHGKVPVDFAKSTSVQNLVTRVSRALEKYYNKSHKFPDFQDVRILMGKLSAEGGCKLKPESLQQLARSLFEEFGDMLQKRRLYDEYKVCNEYLHTDDEDPYYYDPILAAKLEENKKNRSKEKDVLQRFTLKQASLKESGFSDSASHSSSGGESDEEKVEKKTKANKPNSSDESNSDDPEHSDFVSSKKKSNKRKNSDSSKSLEDSCDSNEEDTKNQKIKKRKTKKFKQTKSSDNSDNEEAIEKKQDTGFEDSQSKSKISGGTESDLDEPAKKKFPNTDEKCENAPDNTNEISNIDEESASMVCYDYENAPTIVMDKEAEKIRSGAHSGVAGELLNNKEEVKDVNEEYQVRDNIVVIIDEENEERNQKNIPIDNSLPVLIIDEDSCAEEPDTRIVQSEGNSANNLEEEVNILGSMSSNNTTGILITDVMTCKESFTNDVILLSDDEEQRPNVLSQEDVLQLIPIIFGKQE